MEIFSKFNPSIPSGDPLILQGEALDVGNDYIDFVSTGLISKMLLPISQLNIKKDLKMVWERVQKGGVPYPVVIRYCIQEGTIGIWEGHITCHLAIEMNQNHIPVVLEIVSDRNCGLKPLLLPDLLPFHPETGLDKKYTELLPTIKSGARIALRPRFFFPPSTMWLPKPVSLRVSKIRERESSISD